MPFSKPNGINMPFGLSFGGATPAAGAIPIVDADPDPLIGTLIRPSDDPPGQA